MIRDIIYKDIESINTIGLQIKDNFKELYNIKEFVEKDYAKVYVFEIDNKVVGFIQIEEHFEISDIINIAVDKEYQKKGIGELLISYVLSTTESEKVLLEVRESNLPAIHLYEKCGFKEINRRKKYYGNEDAIIMERSLV